MVSRSLELVWMTDNGDWWFINHESTIDGDKTKELTCLIIESGVNSGDFGQWQWFLTMVAVPNSNGRVVLIFPVGGSVLVQTFLDQSGNFQHTTKTILAVLYTIKQN